MSLPHYGMWDRLAVVFEAPSRDGERAVPFLGKLGKARRTRDRGLGFAIGVSLRALSKLWTLDLRSPKLRVVLARHWRSLLMLFVYMAGAAAVAILLMVSSMTSQPYILLVLVAWFLGSVVWGWFRNSGLKDWQVFVASLRRRALLHTSGRFRRLHVDAGSTIDAEQLDWYVQERRRWWLDQLEKVSRGQRAAFAFREIWWSSLLSVGYIGFMVANSFGVLHLGPGGVMPVILLQTTTIFIPSFVARRRLKRLRQSLEEYSCPDCGYPLADFAAGTWRGAEVQGLGPARCSECGVPWPLLPPPRVRVRAR